MSIPVTEVGLINPRAFGLPAGALKSGRRVHMDSQL
jgi:hypothetical protein